MKKLSNALLLSVICPGSAYAGMTSYSLSDIYKLRLEELSFFLVVFLFCSVMFRFLWNFAVKEMKCVPRLGWRQSFCLSMLLGIVMLLVLTMISGIREVLTPGAWRRQGSAYKLNAEAQEPARLRSILHLRGALIEFARNNEGRFPKHDYSGEISDKLWEAPDGLGSHYIYRSGQMQVSAGAPETEILVVEPLNFGDSRFAILTSGEIQRLTAAEIQAYSERSR